MPSATLTTLAASVTSAPSGRLWAARNPMRTRLPRTARNPFGAAADDSGSIAVTFALLLIPMMLIFGLVVDYARMVQCRAILQNAVDEAALAGASVFTTSDQGANAATVATNYFNRAILPATMKAAAPTVTTNANGTINPALGTAVAYTVTVSANATVSTTLLSMLLPSVSMTATGTASDPVVSAKLGFTNVNSVACDGNAVYLYQVPKNASGSGYDFGSVPTWSTGSSGNYYEIGNSTGGSLPSGQALPTISANQPLGVAMVNQTNGNTGNSGCGVTVTGANSYGAPHKSTQTFYSSLLLNGQPPTQNSNYNYTVTVTQNSGGTITGVTATVGSQTWSVPVASSSYNNLSTYLGINAPSTGKSNCTSSSTTSGSGWSATTTTAYNCRTQYFTSSSSSTPNCVLYVQTGVTPSYLGGLSNSSSAPAAALTKCFSPTTGGGSYSAPTCAQLSALQSGGSNIAPAAVYWWDDAGGVGPGEQYYGPSSHCSATSSNGPGYGEDCQYKNNFFAMQCQTTGGSGSGFTEVVLSQ